jgi:hypothetical protein
LGKTIRDYNTGTTHFVPAHHIFYRAAIECKSTSGKTARSRSPPALFIREDLKEYKISVNLALR